MSAATTSTTQGEGLRPESAVSSQLLEDVRAFIHREADLADEHAFDEWLSLWDLEGEIVYWIPCGGDDYDPARHLSIAYDNRSALGDRIFRLKSYSAHAARPRSRMRRLLTNITVDSVGDGLVQLHANFMLAEVRKSIQDIFCGRVEYVLRQAGDSLLIKAKKVLLINNDEFIDNLGFIL